MRARWMARRESDFGIAFIRSRLPPFQTLAAQGTAELMAAPADARITSHVVTPPVLHEGHPAVRVRIFDTSLIILSLSYL